MDQCEDREEGVPPSKSTLCGEHESQTKAQRNQPGPELYSGSDSDSSDSSHKSDQSKERSFDSKVQPASAAKRKQPGPESDPGSGSDSDSSCLSFKSDHSKGLPFDFKIQQASGSERFLCGKHESKTKAQRDRASGPDLKTEEICRHGQGMQKHSGTKRKKTKKSKCSCVLVKSGRSAENCTEFPKNFNTKSHGNQETPHTGPDPEPTIMRNAEEREPFLDIALKLKRQDEDKEKPAMSAPYSLVQQPYTISQHGIEIPGYLSYDQSRQLAHTPMSLSSGQLDTSYFIEPGLDDEPICIEPAPERFTRLEGDLNRPDECKEELEGLLSMNMDTWLLPAFHVEPCERETEEELDIERELCALAAEFDELDEYE